MMVIFLILGIASIQAQNSNKKVFTWFDLEGGIGYQPEYEQPTAGKFGWQLQINRNLISINMTSVGSGFVFHSEIGMLYGRIFTPLESKFTGSASTGLSYVTDIQTQFGLFGGPSGPTSTFQGLGFPIQINFQYRVFKYLALSTTAFGNINRDQNFGGITLGIQLGKFKD